MLKIIESIDLSTESGLDSLYFLFKTSSSTTNLELLSKIQTFTNSYDFLHHYTNKDINLLFNYFSKLEENYLSICNNGNHLKFSENTEKYISIFSNFILLFNLIIKNMNIIKSILLKIQNIMIKYYSENLINSDLIDKINEFSNNLLKLSLNEELNKINCTFNKENFGKENINTANTTHSNINDIIKDKNNNEEKLDDYYSMNNEDIITPYFSSKDEKNNSQISLINSNDDNSNNNNLFKLKMLKKKDSIGSIISLQCINYSKNINNENSNLEKNTLINLEDKKIEVKSIILNNIKVINSTNNITLNISKKKYIKNNKSGKKKINNSNDTSILSFLLKTISELYKKRNIDSPQKIKIKKLIISKSSKERNIFYNSIINNIDLFIQEIKNI